MSIHDLCFYGEISKVIPYLWIICIFVAFPHIETRILFELHFSIKIFIGRDLGDWSHPWVDQLQYQPLVSLFTEVCVKLGMYCNDVMSRNITVMIKVDANQTAQLQIKYNVMVVIIVQFASFS